MTQITRRKFLSAGAVLAAEAGLGDSLAQGRQQASGAPADEEGRKNVLLLMSDQHRPESLGVRGDTAAKTPNLDALARSGVRFDHAYCADPVCTPSRASLLTGLYVHHHKTYNNATPWPFEHKTVAHAFAQTGYMTALVGKMHFVDAQTHGFAYKLDFNDWYQYLGPKTKLRAEEIIDPNSGSGLPQIDDLWRDYGDPWTGVIERDDREGYVAVGRISALAEEDHFESFVARESIRFLRNHGTKRPFFLVSSFLKPHDPFMPAERFAKMFHAEDMKLPDTWGKVDLATVPRFIRENIHYNWATPELKDPEQAKLRIALYYAGLAQTDDCIGKVLDALKELGLDRNTIVLYTSDHGEMLGVHGLWQKFVFYEPSAGVPLIFRAPGITPENAVCENLASLVQVFPTLTELCGLATPAGLDEVSFAADLREPQTARARTVFAEHALPGPRSGYMIRRGDLKYSYYVDDMPELYNLRDDPEEMRNLALQPEHRDTVEEMRSRLFAWYRPPQAR
ncbi:MAG: sulfatase family protein [Terriglobia bacterium]